ncbi:MAG: Ku protein [Myxococcota bacterium]|nr:Ku protein [Myxococcota bacterium]
MAARATSSGTISFGLVSIPIKVYTAARSKAVRFNMLDGETRSRVKQQYVNANGDVVERSDMVKGYEYSRDQYVVFTDEELKALESKSDRSIEIEDFVPMDRVDPIYFGNSQLLGPDKGGAKAYRLLNEAMIEMGQVAIGRFNTRGRQQLVLIRPRGRGLVLHALHYADEVASFDDIEFGDDVELTKREVELANQLIEQLQGEMFEPEKYEDGYRTAVLEAVDRKVAGEDVVVAPKAKEQDQIIDLMAALKKSLEEKKGAGPVKVSKARAAKPRRKKAASE